MTKFTRGPLINLSYDIKKDYGDFLRHKGLQDHTTNRMDFVLEYAEMERERAKYYFSQIIVEILNEIQLPTKNKAG
jgi:hypothetical protein